MELLADHYGIPSINFGIRVTELLKQNKLMMDAKVIETAVPKESPDRDKQIRERWRPIRACCSPTTVCIRATRGTNSTRRRSSRVSRR
jgi:hypothetical protein